MYTSMDVNAMGGGRRALERHTQMLDKRVINSNMLTSVPKRGKMINTQKYIRDNLQAYADNKYFAFTKKTKE